MTRRQGAPTAPPILFLPPLPSVRQTSSIDRTGMFQPRLTAFRNGKVDLQKYAELIERQTQAGSHGIVVTGTTAEPSSLTIDERSELVRVAVETVAKRIPVVAATGSQSFAETIELTKM